MPSSKSRSVLRKAALQSQLVTPQQLDQAVELARQKVAESERTGDDPFDVTDSEIADALTSLRYVTSYQAEQLKAGRSKLTLGPYLITDWIAQGGMGQVFKAKHQLMGREVAVKVLPHSRSTPNSVANFTREIRTQAILDHVNLVRAFDAGHDGNVYYLVTEYVPGTDLRRLVRTMGKLKMEHAASIISQAAMGLQSAHEKHLIHRDVKPGNILVTSKGLAKVSDLGLAGFLRGPENDPHAKRIVGTADYISPEQIRTPEAVSPASDIYSLGCTLYYAVTGKVPFPGGSTRDKARRHCEDTPWHPRRFNQDLSDEFVDLIAEMMDKSQQARIQTASEVVARLAPFVQTVVPIAMEQTAGSPWTAPVPDDGTQMTMDGSSESLSQLSQNSQNSQYSQATDRLAAARQETNRDSSSGRRPPVPFPVEDLRWGQPMRPVLFALAIAVPVSMLMGALIALVAMLLAVK